MEKGAVKMDLDRSELFGGTCIVNIPKRLNCHINNGNACVPMQLMLSSVGSYTGELYIVPNC